MTRYAGSLVTAADFQLPAVVTAFGNGTNSITTTATWTDLPSTSCIAAITNPHPTADMLVSVQWGAWLHRDGSNVRCCPRVSGSLTLAAGIGSGGNGPIGWGEIPTSAISGNPQQKHGTATYTLPASGTAATFTMQGFREAATGSVWNVNYATIRIIPLYFTGIS